MKKAFLLFSSAVLVVAGPVSAADLPAKKSAPAAKAAALCPVFGDGFFQIPGGDTCIKLSGYAYGEISSSNGLTSVTPAARLIVDTRSNSEIGAVRGYIRSNFYPAASSYAGGSTGSSSADGDRAYAQIGGLSAGAFGSTADISGSQGNAFGSGLGGGSGVGVKYAFSSGPVLVTFAAENSVDRNSVSKSASNPDLLAALSTDIGGGKATLVGVTHKNAINQGYAYLGAISVPAGPVTAGVYGGASYGAIAYTGAINSALTNASDLDTSGTNVTSGTNMGGWLSFSAGKGTAYVDYGYRNASNSTKNSNVSGLGVGYAYAVGGGFTVTPEYLNSQTNSEGTTSTSNTVYLRINREF